MRRLAICTLAIATLMACGEDTGTPVRDSGPGGDGGLVDTGMPDAPDGGGTTCVDDDDDGYGAGCALGADCDDADPAVSPAATETCNAIDDDCDDATDEDVGAPSCALTEGVCAGATARCGATGFLECDATDYGADYEGDETACDGADNDCDGITDEGCACTDGATQACGSDVGVCMPGTQTCVDSAWGACAGEVAPMGEVCDGMDNDCDGADDELTDLVAPNCPLTLGVCAGSVRACGGAAGWIACAGTTSYGGDYQAAETLCDGLDNDCDGVVDPGCACTDGTTQACGTDVGACMAGMQTCVAGAWGACAGEVAPAPETCDGLDNDCDGTVDDGVIAP
ncbi:MAG: MopE-related protein, partial [Myxococcota bacterium]|nr:MopE-related protein [Myxococcota bacterium]